MSGFDSGLAAAQQRYTQRQNIAEQQRVEQQNTVGARLMDAINNASNIKPQTKDENGNLIDNPAYADAQKAKQDLITQYIGLNSPAQHATFADRLHGLIFGHPTDQHQQPALSPNSSPVAPAPAPAAAGPEATSSTAPAHPFETGNPLLAKMQEGLGALKNHLKAAAHPLTPPPAPNTAEIAQYTRDPGEVAAERNQALWGIRGENAVKVAEIRKDALLASLQARPPRLLSETTIPDLLNQIKVDPTMAIYGPNGQELTPSQLAEMPAGTIAREFRAGSQIFYALGDQHSKTLNVNGQIYDIPAIGGINLSGPNANSTVVGRATSTLPKTSSNVTEDPFGLKTKSARTSETQIPLAAQGMAAAGTPEPGGSGLLVRPGATPQPVNPGARAPGTAPSGGAVKSKPVSANAPSTPSSQPITLDENGHIPQGVGNDLVRQFANGILDGRDPKEIGNPKAQGAALALVEKAVPGYSRGAFTPKEKIQFQTAITFLDQLKDSDSLNVLDSFWAREKLARVMKDPTKSTFMSRLAAAAETKPEQELVRNIQAAAGVVQGLSGITRNGKPTNAGVATLKTELPNVFQSPSSDDARKRIENLLKEADIALSTNPRDVGKGGPKSNNAPPPPRPAGVPSDAVWNQQANNGKGQWEK